MKLLSRESSCYSLFIFLFILTFSACREKERIIQIDPAFAQYIEGFTSGVISKNGTIKILLAANVTTGHTIGEETKHKLFKFSPSVEGKAVWTDASTIEFQPTKPLKPGQLYTVTFSLGKIAGVPDKYHDFTFNFQTIQPAFQVNVYGLRSSGDSTKMFLEGNLETADAEDAQVVEKLLEAVQNKQQLKINWDHVPHSNVHQFTIENIKRTTNEQVLLMKWNGKALQTDSKGEKEFRIPAIGDFKVLDVLVVNEENSYASVLFSDPVSTEQDLTGLITFENTTDVTYSVDGSEVKVFPGDKPEGNYTLHVNAGIKNIYGKSLLQGYTANVFFENRLPKVKILGNGNILPVDGKLTLPFESVNLNAIDVSIIKIYENNVPQFLQINGLNGDYELRRVGKPIVQKTIKLNEDPTLDLKEKQRFSLDIDELLKAEPGAIYRVTIGFKPGYSIYPCEGATPESESENNGYYSEKLDEDDGFWQNYDNYYPFGYDWENRNNPCHAAYYNKDKWSSRNIIASNLGVTAKKGSNNELNVFVNDLLTTGPVEGVEIKVLNYQNRILETGKTNSEGILKLSLKQSPFLLIARKKDDITYLKVNEGSGLPLSRFDISGEEVQKGIKGFIFGERGVWRPGDSMFINFIINTEEASLPQDHPIELELYTPQGMLYHKLLQTNAPGGYNVFKTATSKESPTGNWLVKIKAGGATFEKRVRIETVMPNRLNIDLTFGNDTILSRQTHNDAHLFVNWLFGAPARNIKVKADASLSVKQNPFPGWKGYSFINPASDFSGPAKTIFEGEVNENGEATLQPKFETGNNAPGMLTASIFIKAFEPGGAFSIKNLQIPYSPFESYVGLKLPQGDKTRGFLPTGKTHTAEIVRVNHHGKIINEPQQLTVKLYRIQWRWWWDESSENLENFTQDKYNKLIKSQTLTLQSGKAKWNFSVGQNDWGRYLILVTDENSGHTTGEIIYLDEPGWQNRGDIDDPTAASMLSFSANKDTYSPGEEMTVTIPSHEGGKALITIENGSRVIQSQWVNTQAKQTIVKIKATEDMAPNAYIYVSMLQPHSQTANDLPIRMYGVIPVKIEDKNKVLQPLIVMPNSLEPQKKATLTVKEQHGREMYYSVAIVDEGLLSLTNFKTPDPLAYFNARSTLGVKTWDIYDFVIGARANKMDRILTIGGDQEGGGLNQPKEANRFEPVVKYLGPFLLKKGAQNAHDFTLPQYIGKVRVMVVAANKGSYGSAEKNVQVKKPLMLLATAPRVLSPGETVEIPVSVFAMEKNIKSVQVKIQSNGLMAVKGDAGKTITFQNPGEQLIYFPASVADQEGILRIKITGTSGTHTAETEIEINVKNPNEVATRVLARNLEGGEKWATAIEAIGNRSEAEAVIELSSIPALNLEKRLGFLINYPHGCAEQIVSGAFPQLYLHQLTKLTEEKSAAARKNVRAVIAALQNYQLPTGGFSYWPGNSQADEWSTSYAGHFLLEAQKQGFTVNNQMLQKWRQYQSGMAVKWAPSTTNFFGGDLTQAYRLFTLALAKAPEIGAMNRLREFKYLSAQAKWRLAAAYAVTSQTQVALEMISNLSLHPNENYDGGPTYGSQLRDKAMILETLTLLNRKREAAELVSEIAAQLSKEEWYSTQTTAYALLAISEYTGKNEGKNIRASVNINGKNTEVNSNEFLVQIPVNISSGKATASVENKGNAVLFARIINKGKPLAALETPAQTSNLLSMKVEYLDNNLQPVNMQSLSQGTDFMARVTVRNTGNRGTYEQLALSQIFPSGWEIINARMNATTGFTSSRFEYQDIRDDRVYTYFNLKQNETKTFYVQLNAAYKGSFYLPVTSCYDMYNAEISAATAGKKIEVTD